MTFFLSPPSIIRREAEVKTLSGVAKGMETGLTKTTARPGGSENERPELKTAGLSLTMTSFE